MNLLILNNAILAADFVETADAFTTADAIIPKHVIEGYEVVTADVPDGFTVQGYEYVDGAVVAKVPVVVPPTQGEYTAALEAMYDAKAAERRYDSRLTCALRAGYPGPFQSEGTAFAVWMDTCNMTAYDIMGQVLAGDITMPSIAELLAMMPPMEWPA